MSGNSLKPHLIFFKILSILIFISSSQYVSAKTYSSHPIPVIGGEVLSHSAIFLKPTKINIDRLVPSVQYILTCDIVAPNINLNQPFVFSYALYSTWGSIFLNDKAQPRNPTQFKLKNTTINHVAFKNMQCFTRKTSELSEVCSDFGAILYNLDDDDSITVYNCKIKPSIDY